MINRNRLQKIVKIVTAMLLVIGVVFVGWWLWIGSNNQNLWDLVNQQCLMQKQAACIDVIRAPNDKNGYAIVQDNAAPLHFMLIPITKINRNRSEQLLEPGAIDYLNKAWDARFNLAMAAGQPVPRDVIALAVNASWGRRHHQLAVHISCIKPEIKAQLESQLSRFSDTWTPVEFGLLNHDYLARTLTEAQFHQQNPFRRAIEELPDARNNIDKYGVAIMAYYEKGDVPMFLMLVNRVNVLSLNVGQTDEILDYRCDLLKTYQHY